jgi:phosphatidylglycerol:prolipoprotein diacylglycerol transferase
MYPELLRIGTFALNSYYVMALLGFLIPLLIMRREFRRESIDPQSAVRIFVYAYIGGVLGSRAYYIVEHWPIFSKNPELLITNFTGLVWYGGLFGGALAVLLAIRRSSLPVWKVADHLGPMLLLGNSFGRLGCFLSGDGDYGPPSEVPWAMAFPNGLVPTIIPVHPTPLYDIALNLTFFSILWNLRKRDYPNGTIFGLYLISAGTARFITEFWRNTPTLAFGWMTLAQMISLALIAAGILLTVWATNRARAAVAVATMPSVEQAR